MAGDRWLTRTLLRVLPRSAIVAGALAVVIGASGHAPHSGSMATAHRAPPPTASFPFVYDDGRLFVPVRLSGDTTRWFIFDTGVGSTIVDAALAAQLGLTTTDAGTVTGAGAHRMRIGRTAGMPVSVGGVALAPPSIEVAPLDSLVFPFSGLHAPGVIGSQFFVEHVVEVDFDDHVIRVYDPATYEYQGAGAVIALDFVLGAPSVSGTLTLPDGTRKPARLLVDLGAKATLLVTEPFIRATGLREAFPRRVRATLGAGAGGETRYDFVRVPKLTLGQRDQAEIASFVAGLSVENTLRSDEYDALLGAEFLSRYRVIFDYAHKRLILEPRSPMALPAELDMSGLYLVRDGDDGGRVVVHRVVEDSPADRAGIRVGDVVVRVNGESASGTSLWPWRAALRSGDGRAVTVTIDRAGENLVKTFVLRRLV
jgi:hypothetical protein